MCRLDLPEIDQYSTHLRLWLVNLSYLEALYGPQFHALCWIPCSKGCWTVG